MEIKLYKEGNRTIIVIENASVDLDKAVLALVQTAATSIDGVETPSVIESPMPEPNPESEVGLPAHITEKEAADMLAQSKEDALIYLLGYVRGKSDDERDVVISVCKKYAQGIKNDLPQYDFDDKMRLIQACWKSHFKDKHAVLRATPYATTEEFDNCASEAEVEQAANAFAEMLFKWGNR